jgi:hypothetical protein
MESVVAAQKVLSFQIAQLNAMGELPSNIDVAARSVETQLGLDRPWRDIAGLAHDLDQIRECYQSERKKLLEWQESRAEQVRMSIKRRSGFSTLSADRAHAVLRPLTTAVTNTSAEAVAPTLLDLKDPFLLALNRAESAANEALDRVLSEGSEVPIQTVNLELRHREIKTAADVEALVDEIRTRLMEQIQAGTRIRLL